MSIFKNEWARFHGDTPPIAHMLREAARKPWIRFHALPNSIRYAETKSERDEIQQRAATLANEALGRNSDCWLVQVRIEEYSQPNWKPLQFVPDPDLRYDDDEDDFHWIASASPVLWHEATFRDLLTDIADDHTGPTLWCNRKTGRVFAPYDGGFDLFPTTMVEVAELKRRYGQWLSPEESGL